MNCNKIPYATKKEAREVKNFIENKFNCSRKFYQCDHCGLWHITSKTDDLEKNTRNLELYTELHNQIRSGEATRNNRKKTWSIVYNGNGYVLRLIENAKRVEIVKYFTPRSKKENSLLLAAANLIDAEVTL